MRITLAPGLTEMASRAALRIRQCRNRQPSPMAFVPFRAGAVRSEMRLRIGGEGQEIVAFSQHSLASLSCYGCRNVTRPLLLLV